MSISMSIQKQLSTPQEGKEKEDAQSSTSIFCLSSKGKLNQWWCLGFFVLFFGVCLFCSLLLWRTSSKMFHTVNSIIQCSQPTPNVLSLCLEW